MCKAYYVDTEMLDLKIANSGLKIVFICENLGISRQAFNKKRVGAVPFKVSEVFVLCALLHIDTREEKEKIFTPKVDKKDND